MIYVFVRTTSYLKDIMEIYGKTFTGLDPFAIKPVIAIKSKPQFAIKSEPQFAIKSEPLNSLSGLYNEA